MQFITYTRPRPPPLFAALRTSRKKRNQFETFPGVTEQSVHNLAKGWKSLGLVALINRHKGGQPPTLAAERVDAAGEIVTIEGLTLPAIEQRVRARYPDAGNVSVSRLEGLRERRMSCKRCRNCKENQRIDTERAKGIFSNSAITARANLVIYTDALAGADAIAVHDPDNALRESASEI